MEGERGRDGEREREGWRVREGGMGGERGGEREGGRNDGSHSCFTDSDSQFHSSRSLHSSS